MYSNSVSLRSLGSSALSLKAFRFALSFFMYFFPESFSIGRENRAMARCWAAVAVRNDRIKVEAGKLLVKAVKTLLGKASGSKVHASAIRLSPVTQTLATSDSSRSIAFHSFQVESISSVSPSNSHPARNRVVVVDVGASEETAFDLEFHGLFVVPSERNPRKKNTTIFFLYKTNCNLFLVSRLESLSSVFFFPLFFFFNIPTGFVKPIARIASQTRTRTYHRPPTTRKHVWSQQGCYKRRR